MLFFQVGGGWTPAGSDVVSGGGTGKHRAAVLVRKSAPGSPTPSSASSYGSASPGNDLIASASSALRRLHFKSAGAQRMLNRSKQQQQQQPQSQQSSPVPKLKVLGSSSISVESSATVNTSTDSSAATMTTVTDDTENEDSVDNPVGIPHRLFGCLFYGAKSVFDFIKTSIIKIKIIIIISRKSWKPQGPGKRNRETGWWQALVALSGDLTGQWIWL